MKTHQKHLSTLFAIAALLGGTSQAFAVTIAPSLVTASNFVVLGGAGVTCTASAVSGYVFWHFGTAATTGTDTAFTGNILAGSAITFTGANATLVGRALAKTAVTMTGANLSQGSSVVVVPSPVCK